MAPLGSKDELSDEQKTLTEFVRKRFEASERLHKDLDPRFNTYYSLSRNYKRLRTRHAQATTPNDKDTVRQEFIRVFGDDLFVPYIFTVIETVLPGILSTSPEVSVKPTQEGAEAVEAADPVKRLIERDQGGMNYEMRLQETVRSGLRYGIGVQKLFWEKKFRSGKKVVPMEAGPGYKVVDDNEILVYEGPKVESVDIFDFFWDPIAFDIESCGYVIHRTWRSMRYIEDRVQEGKERRASGQEGGWAELDLERIKSFATTTGRGEVWAERMQAAGISHYETEGNELFEVWEYHDRDNVYTILGKEMLVQEAENPFLHGDLPFQIFRPTVVEHEFVGIGEAEPIAHLNYELNTMRGQRRDAATIALNPPFFFTRGALNPKQIMWGAGVFNPVDGIPEEVLKQVQQRDLPGSSVGEEQALKSDIELATGLSEFALGQGGAETATVAQLDLQVANKRIKQKTKNMHVELLRPAAHQMLELYRQNITTPEQSRSVRVEPTGAAPPTGYQFIPVGPKELHAPIEVEPIDGSTEPENEAQKRADAVQEVDALGPVMEQVDPRKLAQHLLRKFGHDEPNDLLKAPGPDTPQTVMAVGQAMEQAGIDPEHVKAILEAAHNQIVSPSLSGEAPPEAQPEEPEGAASQNGSAPEPVAPGG
jgi:hypothetical protein